MFGNIEKYLKKNDIELCLDECIKTKNFYLGLFIGTIHKKNTEKYFDLMKNLNFNISNTQSNNSMKLDNSIVTNTQSNNSMKYKTVKLLCNYTSTENLTEIYNKMSQDGNYTWNNIKLITKGDPDYYCVINSTVSNIDTKKTVVFRMEPNMAKNTYWGEWSNPDDSKFLKILRHEKADYNNVEWHISKTYQQLQKDIIQKDNNLNCFISTVLSDKYTDPGHMKRVDFVKFLDKKNENLVHVFGNNKFNYKNYKNSLPYHCKDDGLLPYKYHFNVENNDNANYFTEKLIDGILSECLVFYSGCYNVKQYIDERAYVQLGLSNFENDYNIIQKAIEEDWYTQRLPYIKEAKKKILNELQFFPRLEKILNLI